MYNNKQPCLLHITEQLVFTHALRRLAVYTAQGGLHCWWPGVTASTAVAPTGPLFGAATIDAEAHSVAHHDERQPPALVVVAATDVNCYSSLRVSFQMKGRSMHSSEHFLGALVLFVVIHTAVSSRCKPALGMAGERGLWGPFSLNHPTQPWLVLPRGKLSQRASRLTLGLRDICFSSPMIFLRNSVSCRGGGFFYAIGSSEKKYRISLIALRIETQHCF